MLEDFLAARPSVCPNAAAPATASPRSAGFQSLFAARAAEFAPVPGTRRIEETDGPEISDAPQIELVQEKGVAQQIIVTCTCGQRIEIECEY